MFDEVAASDGANRVRDAFRSGRDGEPSAAAWLLSRSLVGLAAGVRAIAFWLAALLPVAVLVGLLLGSVVQQLPVLAGLLSLNAVCAVVGHGYSPEE